MGLAGRSALDKVLALRGGAELVAHWGQLSSVIELVASVALAGVGMGLTVLVGQRAQLEQVLLRESIRLGLAISLPVMLAVMALGWHFADQVAGSGFPPELLGLASVVGFVATIPGMINSYWVGKQRRDLVLVLAIASAALPFAAAVVAPGLHLLAATAIASAVPVLAVVFVIRPRTALPHSRDWHPHRRALLQYVLPGIAIGVLSPASLVAARSIVASAMSWHDTGMLQALLRLSDWVASVAGGVLSVYFLPRLSATCGSPLFATELRRAALVTIVPSAAAFALLFVFQRPVLALLYDQTFRASDGTLALFLAGSLARIASWVPLMALFAMRRTAAITVGEFLSLPLFALLLALNARGLTLEFAAALWLASYLAYGAFNFWAMKRNP